MSTFNKLRKIIQEEIKKAINESDDDPKQARKNAFDLTDKARSVVGYAKKIPAYQTAIDAHKKAASLMISPRDKKEHLVLAKKLETDVKRFTDDMNNGDGAYRSDMKNNSKLTDLDESKDDDDLLMRATELGELAFKNDKPRYPGGDKKLMDLISDNKEKSKDLMKAWINGWDTKNLSEPVDLD